ncbi:MAG TPA: response regulator [Candidatus Kapabacteria bacterium]|nr:response regulator [Candidatus Kapabacteria bacterium]
MKILFVEDNANTARAMKVMLELRGYTVDTAGTVAKALECLDADGYDLMISDISLPDGTGYDILSRTSADIPSIALSGYTSHADRAESLAKGFKEFITKPFNPDDLVGAIERFKS